MTLAAGNYPLQLRLSPSRPPASSGLNNIKDSRPDTKAVSTVAAYTYKIGFFFLSYFNPWKHIQTRGFEPVILKPGTGQFKIIPFHGIFVRIFD
jgi:hypothetical protein